MLFVLSKEIRAAKGDKREERERVTHVVWGGGTFFSSRKPKDPVQANKLDKTNYCRTDSNISNFMRDCFMKVYQVCAKWLC